MGLILTLVLNGTKTNSDNVAMGHFESRPVQKDGPLLYLIFK